MSLPGLENNQTPKKANLHVIGFSRRQFPELEGASTLSPPLPAMALLAITANTPVPTPLRHREK